MKGCRVLLLTSGLAVAGCFSRTAATGDTEGVSEAYRPNIVLIMADDMGYSDIGCFGAEIETPNLDSMAANGLRFTQMYNSARCSATRASLLTGLYSHQAGVGWLIENDVAKERQMLVGASDKPAYLDHLSEDTATLAEVLAIGGYHTYMSGKWHLGFEDDYNPNHRGFERAFYLVGGSSSYWSPRQGALKLDGDSFENDYDEFYLTDVFTDYAIQFMEEQTDDEPFFLYLAYNAPHWPLHAYEDDYGKYVGSYESMGGWEKLRETRFENMKALCVVDESWALSEPGDDVEDWDEANQSDMDLRMSVYAGQIDRLDQGVGRIVESLSQKGILDDTLIIFISDNGACQEDADEGAAGDIGEADSWTSYHRSWANASNTPFRWYKHYVHEGGISGPMIAQWPAVITSVGGISDELTHVMDLMATFADLAGVKYPDTMNDHEIPPLEGLSLVPVLEGGEREGHEYLAFEHEANRALRKGDWKIVSMQFGLPWNLYDMKADRSETVDLSEEYPDVVEELQADYDAWADKCGVAPPEAWASWFPGSN